ncbi:Cyclic nucleotide-binding domain [Phytophthora infestans]|uniref:Cyclic nucleotide-binding domain n=1 Tax=Phytophthora infestans TaxID=4787 RepID=A0A833SFG5_PHYIN|nr:Cyclic nucleotide-binding domain [Phytophthora infestans]
METAAAFDFSESDRAEYAGRKASLALQRALNVSKAGAPNVQDQRKCDHELLPTELPASIRDKVARILQERSGKEKIPDEVVDPKAPWHQQLEQHVARLMQRLRSQPLQFRQLLVMAASEPSADCVSNANVSRSFVDARKAYRRVRRAATTLGEETFYMVRGFVRRSEANGVLPQDAQTVRLASLYKLELRRHVTISAVMECIRQADSGTNVTSDKVHKSNRPSLKQSFFRRHTRSARVISSSSSDLDSAVNPRATSAPAGTAGRSGQNIDTESSDKVKSVHAFKLQALERLLAKSWQGSKAASIVSLQPVSVSSISLSDETLSHIQERVTAFLYHQSRENYPLWEEPSLSREETARHLRTFVSTLLTTPLLQGLTIDQLLEVARAARWLHLAPGDTLCVRNTEMDTLMIVMDGSLEYRIDTELNSASVGPVMTVTAPACLGEIAMVRNTERWSRTLVAQDTTGVKVLTLPKLTFETLLHRFFNGGKVVSASTTSLLQPRRPSSSPAVIAKRLTRSVRNSLSGRRPSTAAPFAAMVANITRWHEVRDEKLRDYRAGLEAEQRAAALEALQRAIDEISSASSEEDDVELLQYTASLRSPRKKLWSRHEHYPTYDPTSDEMEHLTGHDSPNEPHDDSSPPQTNEGRVPIESSTETADQLREYYRSLSARRSFMKARIASSIPSDQMAQQSPERKRKPTESTNTTSEAATITTSESTWWPKEEEKELNNAGTDSVAGSPSRGQLQSASLSSQLYTRSAAPSPPKEVPALMSPSKSPPKSSTINSPVRKSKTKTSNQSVSNKDDDSVTLISKMEDIVPETNEIHSFNESNEDPSSSSLSKNQVEDDRAAAVTRARRSALNTLLIRQSTATMAKHSKLLDKETAQQVLIRKHFADTSAAPSAGSRPQSGRPRSGNRPESGTTELNQSHSSAPLPLRADLQRRMDSVLNELLLPPKAKLDLVLKYTHADHFDQFPTAVQLWERVQTAIVKRERMMKFLWDFEMLASDPRRHFRSISTHRLREEKQRDALFYKLNQVSNVCLVAMDELWRFCGDIVCLGERSYREKMKKDYTELLYEVEQERLRIIYNGVRPHVAPAIDENSENSRDEDEKVSGRTLIKVRVPSAVAAPRGFVPHRPLYTKDGSSPKISANYVLEDEAVNIYDNQEQDRTNKDVLNPKFAVNGANADPSSVRFSLATPRESIFVKVEQDATTPEQKDHRRASRVTVQVQQQRKAELLALSRHLEQQIGSQSKDTVQAIRPPEITNVAPAEDAKKAAARMKQQEERESLREMFQQFMKRSKI